MSIGARHRVFKPDVAHFGEVAINQNVDGAESWNVNECPDFQPRRFAVKEKQNRERAEKCAEDEPDGPHRAGGKLEGNHPGGAGIPQADPDALGACFHPSGVDHERYFASPSPESEHSLTNLPSIRPASRVRYIVR